MAAGTHKVTLNSEWRAKIQTARLLIRLQCFALDEVDPTMSNKVKLTVLQVRTIETLLKIHFPISQRTALKMAAINLSRSSSTSFIRR